MEKLRHIKQSIQNLAKRVGVELSGRYCGYPFENPWDGKTVATNGDYGYIGDDIILHEIAHWVVAHPKRRELSNFGLINDFKSICPEEIKAAALEQIYKKEI